MAIAYANACCDDSEKSTGHRIRAILIMPSD